MNSEAKITNSSDVITFHVADMSCNHCVGTITDAFAEAMPGASLKIDLDIHQVSVAGDSETAEAIIRDAGYTPERL